MILAEIHNILLQVADFGEEVVEIASESGGDALTAFGIKIVKWSDFTELVVRFFFNLLITTIIAKGLYYSKTKRKDFLFSFLLMSVVIFILCFTLNNVKVQLGFAFGLFAIFGIMRFRTDGMPIKEMTYLFVIIAVSVINSMISKKVSYLELVFCNAAIIGVLYFLERVWLLRHETVKPIVFDRVDLVHISKRKELIEELEKRTGLVISRVEIIKVDYLRDVAQVWIYYFESEQQGIPTTGSQYSRAQNDNE